MPVGLVRKDYLLNEALDLIGQRLYGHRWTGQELFARKVDPPELVKARRAPIETAVETEQELIEGLAAEQKRTVDAARMEAIETELSGAFARRAKAYQELERIPDPSDQAYLARHKSYERRHSAERHLIEALADGDIESYVLGSMDVPSELWHGQNGFGYDLALSAVCMPRQYSGARRGSVRIREAQFDEWLRAVLPVDATDRADILPEDRCRAFLIEAVRSGQKTKSRDGYKTEAMALIPGLSERAFLHAWAEIVPPDWKRRGRPPSR